MRETFGKRFTLIIEPGFSPDQAETFLNTICR
ncbi:Secretion system apparatus protein ssaK [Salmonella enterica subsp. enterica]|uniref:Secretion system apparatus protein ssaK n=1 Tax=Salmonella enterica I TaxID=59201 RepID=A0A3S4LWE3_SALET|nr:Secretion system apparatus protein ssaK [Salmonella enterica subsp. enterica]